MCTDGTAQDGNDSYFGIVNSGSLQNASKKIITLEIINIHANKIII